MNSGAHSYLCLDTCLYTTGMYRQGPRYRWEAKKPGDSVLTKSKMLTSRRGVFLTVATCFLAQQPQMARTKAAGTFPSGSWFKMSGGDQAVWCGIYESIERETVSSSIMGNYLPA